MSEKDLLKTIETLLPDARKARRQHNEFHPFVRASLDVNTALSTLYNEPYSYSIKDIAQETGLSYHSVRDRLIAHGTITPKPHPKDPE